MLVVKIVECLQYLPSMTLKNREALRTWGRTYAFNFSPRLSSARPVFDLGQCVNADRLFTASKLAGSKAGHYDSFDGFTGKSIVLGGVDKRPMDIVAVIIFLEPYIWPGTRSNGSVSS